MLPAIFAVASGLLALAVYRAVTQSITHDEAVSHLLFVARPWRDLLDGPVLRDPLVSNLHVLQAHLSWLSVAALGTSEFALRLPGVLAAALYLLVVVRLARDLFGASVTTLVAVLLLSLDPAVLDHHSAARGYGLGLAFLFLALLLLVRSGGAALRDEAPSRGALVAAGVSLGLAASANLAYVLPGTGFSIAFAALLARAGNDGRAHGRGVAHFLSFAVPGAAVFLFVSAPLLLHIRPGTYFVGADSLAGAAWSVVDASLSPRASPLLRDPSLAPLHRASAVAALALGAVVAVAITFAALRELLPGPRPAHADGRGPALEVARNRAAVLLLGVGLSATLLLSAILHRALGLRYPAGRMAIYVAPLAWLALLLLARRLGRGTVVPAADSGWPRVRVVARVGVRWALLAVAGLGIARYVLAIDGTTYDTWAFDRSTRRYVEIIRAREEAGPTRVVRLGVTWVLEPGVNFYRYRDRIRWMRPVDRSGPVGAYDYYLLVGQDRALVDRMGLTVIARDDVAGSVLAVP